MSKNNTNLTDRPFTKTPPAKLFLAGLVGIASAVLCRMFATSSLTEIPFLLGQAITGTLLVWGVLEMLMWWKQHRELTAFENQPNLLESTEGAWNQAVQESRDHPEFMDESDLPRTFQVLVEGWSAKITVRYALPLLLLWPGVLLVLFQGLHQLRLTPEESRLPDFSEVFLPLFVLGTEAALAGSVIWACRLLWVFTIQRWKVVACQAVWQHLQKVRELTQTQDTPKFPSANKQPATIVKPPVNEVHLQDLPSPKPSATQPGAVHPTADSTSTTPKETPKEEPPKPKSPFGTISTKPMFTVTSRKEDEDD